MPGKGKSKDEVQHNLAPGDNIEVIEGELIHLQGRVVSVDGNTIMIMPKHEDLKVRNVHFNFSMIEKN